MAHNGEFVTVALTGTSCVGKSSVLNGVGELLGKQCVSVPEAARDFFKADPNHLGRIYKPEMGDRFSFEVQSAIQIKHINRMAKAGLHAETILGGGLPFYRGITRVAIIDDRTPLDAAVYVAANGDREGAERLFDEANAWIGLEYYDHFYVLDPTGVPYVNDAERTETFEERQQIHETLLGFFAEHGIAYTLLTGTEQERIDQVVGAIQGSWASMAPPVSEPLTQFSLTSGPLEAVLWTRAG